jgi:tetratricopeptide (TPR) repeat protein
MTDPHSLIEPLLNSLQQRLSALIDGDPRPILADDALTDIKTIWEVVDEVYANGEIPVNIAQTVGWVHWGRYLALPDGVDSDDLLKAARIFLLLHRESPRLVPKALHHLLDPLGAHRSEDSRGYTAAIVRQATRANDGASLNDAVELFENLLLITPPHVHGGVDLLFKLAVLLRARHGKARAGQDLSKAVRSIRLAMESAPVGYPDMASMLATLAMALIELWDFGGTATDLEDGIDAARGLAATMPRDDPNLPGVLGSIGRLLRDSFAHSNDRRNLHDSAQYIRQAVAIGTAAPDLQSELEIELGVTLGTRFEHLGASEDLMEASEIFRRNAHLSNNTVENRTKALALLGAALNLLYRMDPLSVDLNEWVETCRETVGLTSPLDATLLARRRLLCDALNARFDRNGNGVDLDECVDTCRQALADVSLESKSLLEWRRELGATLLKRYDHGLVLTDLEASIETLEGALVLDGVRDDESEGVTLYLLQTALKRRHQVAAVPEYLNRAIDAGRRAVMTLALSPRQREFHVAQLTTALYERWDQAGDAADLERLIGMARDSIREASESGGDLGEFLAWHCKLLVERAQSFGTADDVEEGILITVEALKATSPREAGHTSILSNLGVLLIQRFDLAGDIEDLSEGVRACNEAVLLEDTTHASHSTYLSNLGIAFLKRFELTADFGDLSKALDCSRRAIDMSSPDDAVFWISNMHLGAGLRLRYWRFRDRTDLEEAVRAGREAIRFAAERQQDVVLDSLAETLVMRFEVTGQSADLDEAIALLRRATGATPPSSGRMAVHLNNLGMALRARAEKSGDRADLEEAITTFRRLLASDHQVTPAQMSHMSNLGLSLRTRFMQLGNAADLDEATRLMSDVVAATPPGRTRRAEALTNLAGLLRIRFERMGDRHAAQASIEAYKEAASSISSAAEVRAVAAAYWGRVAASLPNGVSELSDALDAGVNLLPLLAWRGLHRRGRESQLAEWRDLARDAVATAIEAGRFSRGVELVEHGRGVIWTQLLEVRTDIARLREYSPAHASRFDQLRKELDA